MIKTLSAVVMVALGIFMMLSAVGNQPYVDVVPCDTDTDCMEKNPHIEFSLEN